MSPHRSRDVAAVDRGDVGGGFQLQRLMQEGLRHVVGGHLAAEQVAAHVILLGQAARLRARRDHVRVNRPERMRSALTALARMPSAP